MNINDIREADLSLAVDYYEAVIAPETPKGVEHHFFLHGEINAEQPWWTRLNKILVRRTNKYYPQSIHLHLTTQGGSVVDALTLIDLIDRAELPVHLYVSGSCMSVGAIFLFGGRFTSVHIDPATIFLFHPYRTKVDKAKITDTLNELHFQERHYRYLTRRSIRKVLTEKQVDDVCQGKELYLLGSEVLMRYMQYKESLKEKVLSSQHPVGLLYEECPPEKEEFALRVLQQMEEHSHNSPVPDDDTPQCNGRGE